MGLEPIGAVVTGANLLLGSVIGVRLLRLARTSGGPAKWLGLHLLIYSVAATMVSATLYMGWSDPSLAMPDGVARAMNALFEILRDAHFDIYAPFMRSTIAAIVTILSAPHTGTQDRASRTTASTTRCK